MAAWHKDASQLPAALPGRRDVAGDSPGLATAPSACTSWARRTGPRRSGAAAQLLGCGVGAWGGSVIALTPPPPLLQLVPPAHSPAGTMNVFDRNINFDALFKFSHM